MQTNDIVHTPDGALAHVIKVSATIALVTVHENGDLGFPLPPGVHPDTKVRVFPTSDLRPTDLRVTIRPILVPPDVRGEMLERRTSAKHHRPGVWHERIGEWVGGDHWCADCLERDLFAKSYMVQTALWKTHVPENGIVCAPCFEERLGRRLHDTDLVDCILSAEYLVLRDLSPAALKAYRGETRAAIKAYRGETRAAGSRAGAQPWSSLWSSRYRDYAPFARLHRERIAAAVAKYRANGEGGGDVIVSGGVPRRVCEWADYLTSGSCREVARGRDWGNSAGLPPRGQRSALKLSNFRRGSQVTFAPFTS